MIVKKVFIAFAMLSLVNVAVSATPQELLKTFESHLA